nr:hypothetical protein [Tanacetum cinerariifolium]
MSNTNNTMQTQTSNTLHNAIMEAGGKDRPPMLTPGNYVQWKSRIKRYIDTKPNHELIHYCLKNPPYKFTWADKEVPVTEGSSVTTTKAIKRLKQGESINVQDLETNLYWEFGKFTSRDGESLESYYLRSQQATTKNRRKAIVNSSPPIYDHEPSMVAEDDEMSKDKEIDKLMALISLSFKGTGYDNQRICNGMSETKTGNDATYHKKKMLLCKQEEAGFQLNAQQADWRNDTDDESEDQELEEHYL